MSKITILPKQTQPTKNKEISGNLQNHKKQTPLKVLKKLEANANVEYGSMEYYARILGDNWDKEDIFLYEMVKYKLAEYEITFPESEKDILNLREEAILEQQLLDKAQELIKVEDISISNKIEEELMILIPGPFNNKISIEMANEIFSIESFCNRTNPEAAVNSNAETSNSKNVNQTMRYLNEQICDSSIGQMGNIPINRKRSKSDSLKNDNKVKAN